MDYSATKEAPLSAEPCTACSGSKLTHCHACCGEGNVRCIACFTSASHSDSAVCAICSGLRELRCTRCSRGHVSCSVCAGTGLRW